MNWKNWKYFYCTLQNTQKWKMFKKNLQDFPGNTQKQRHSMTDSSLEYLEYSSETPVMERWCFMRSPSKSSKKFLKTSLIERLFLVIERMSVQWILLLKSKPFQGQCSNYGLQFPNLIRKFWSSNYSI